MIETAIEKALTYGTWVSYTLEMGYQQRFKTKSGVTMFGITLDTLDWQNEPNIHIKPINSSNTINHLI